MSFFTDQTIEIGHKACVYASKRTKFVFIVKLAHKKNFFVQISFLIDFYF